MKTILALLVAGIGFSPLATPTTEARPVSPLALGSDSLYINQTVVIDPGYGHRGRYRTVHRRSHGRFRTVKHVYWRHGHRYVTYRRVYY